MDYPEGATPLDPDEMTDYLLQQYFGYAGLNWAGQDLQQVSQQRQSYIQALRQADAHDFQGLLDLFQLVE